MVLDLPMESLRPNFTWHFLLDTSPQSIRIRTNVTKNQTSHDTFVWHSTPKYKDSSIEMIVLDRFGPKCWERHLFDIFSRHSRDALPCFLFTLLSDGNACSIPAWDIYIRWPYVVWTVRYRIPYGKVQVSVRYGTVPVDKYHVKFELLL
jgi:hypothetical protein